jgi:DNA-binding Xre family transcriptional regulator
MLKLINQRRLRKLFDYRKLWALLALRGWRKEDLRQACRLSSQTITDMGKGGNISGQTLGRICAALNCQPGDIMEYLPEEGAAEAMEQG